MHRLNDEWLDFHVNLKQVYRDLFRLPRQIGLVAALRREGLNLKVRHRAMRMLKT